MSDTGDAGPRLGARPPFLRDIPVSAILDAQIGTADFLSEHGFAPSDEEIEADAARAVFTAITAPTADAAKRKSLALLETPESVRHLVALLTEYDYALIQHADSIRNRLIAGLLEECDDPDPRVRLKAYELTGKIKEVALFEERVTVKTQSMSDEDLDARIRERVERLKRLSAPAEQEPVDIAFTEKEKTE